MDLEKNKQRLEILAAEIEELKNSGGGGGGTVDAYTKAEADNKFAEKTNVYTKTEADNKFAEKATTYTKTEVDEAIAAAGGGLPAYVLYVSVVFDASCILIARQVDLDAFKSLGLSDGAGLFAVLCPGALPAVVLSVDTIIDRSGITGTSGNDPYPDFLKSLGFACRTCQSAVRYEALRIAVILDVHGVLYRIDFSEFSCKIHLDSFETLGLA